MDQEEAKQVQTFKGFIAPTSNYFRMPNEWINICAEITNLAELKVIQYVLRHTWGYHEYDGKPKPITIDEFMHGRKRKDGTRMDKGTGLSKQSVVDGTKRAIKNGYLICEKDETDRARISKSYVLNMATSELDVKNLDIENRGQESRHRGSKTLTSAVKNLDSKGQESRQRSEKETPERHLQKNTTERKNDEPQQKPSTPTQEIHPSIPSSSLIEFDEEENLVYELAKEKKLSFLSKNEKNKKHCSKLVKEGVTTLEQIESLMQFCRQRDYLVGRDLNLGNLAGELDGWLQVQQSLVSSRVLSSYDDPDYVDDTFYAVNVPDEELAEEIGKFVHAYREDDRFELYLQDIMQFKAQFNLTGYDVYTRMIEARRNANPEISSMDDFMYELECLCVGRKVRTA